MSHGVPVVEIENVWKVFGPQPALVMAAIRSEGLTKHEVHERFQCVVGVQDVSISVRQGEIFCIMGLSGSGKSTLIRHINRLIEPSSGTIRINGIDIGGLSPAELRKLRSERLGMVFQSMALLPHRTVRDNVGFPLEIRGVPPIERRQVVDRMLDTVRLGAWGDRMPADLSGGMQQRVGLARAMAADPEILLMDEPFSALDPLIRRDLQDEFMDLSKTMKKTTVFITHDLDEAIRIGSRIAIMKDGKIIQIGTPEDIVTNPADSYVANFVKGISKLNLVTARVVMDPIKTAPHSLDAADWPRAPIGLDLDGLISIATQTDKNILIEDNGVPVGVVTKHSLLCGIQGNNK